MLNNLFSGTENATGSSAQPPTGLDVLAEACQAANLQINPKKPAQPRRKKITVTGGELAHDDFCRDPFKCSIRWELAKIQRKKTYDRLHQENRTLKRKLGEVTAVSEARERKNEALLRKLRDVTAENERLTALLLVHAPHVMN